MKFGINGKEVRKILSIIGLGVFSSILVGALKEEALKFGNPWVVGTLGLIFFAYLFNVK